MIVSALLTGFGYITVAASPSNATNILGRVISQTFLSPQGSTYLVAQSAALSDMFPEQVRWLSPPSPIIT